MLNVNFKAAERTKSIPRLLKKLSVASTWFWDIFVVQWTDKATWKMSFFVVSHVHSSLFFYTPSRDFIWALVNSEAIKCFSGIPTKVKKVHQLLYKHEWMNEKRMFVGRHFLDETMCIDNWLGWGGAGDWIWTLSYSLACLNLWASIWDRPRTAYWHLLQW